MVGTFAAAFLLQCQKMIISKHSMACISIVVAGSFTTLFAFTNSLDVMLLLGAGQGLGFGILHTFATVAILEMWGQRSQPWLQVKPSALGLGGAVGPLLLNRYGYKNAFILTGIISTLCVSIYGLEFLIMRTHKVVRWSTKKLHLRKSSRFQSSYLTVDTSDHQTSLHDNSIRREADAVDNMYLSRDMKFVESVLSNTVEDIKLGDLTCPKKPLTANESGNSLPESAYHAIPSISEVLELAPRLTRALSLCNGDQSANASVRIPSPSKASEPDLHVLSYATTSMIEKIDLIEEATGASVDIKIVPLKFSVVICVFSFFYYGLFYAFSGWVTSYASSTGIAASANDASALTSQYFLWITVGSVISVAWSVLFSTTTLLRFQLCVVATGSVILLFVGSSYQLLNIATAVFGFGNSCIFPLLICVANDYQLTM